MQVAEELGDSIRILKIDTDENPDLSSQLQVWRGRCKRPNLPSCRSLLNVGRCGVSAVVRCTVQ